MSEETSGQHLNTLLAEAGFDALDTSLSSSFDAYLALLVRWNARVNLTAIRDTKTILSRHFVESIACARKLPNGIATLLDFGSGAGFPGIPIALCRPEIAVTLAESQGKKAGFLREAIRTLGISASVHSARAELLQGQFDCVTLRAVDRMESAIKAAREMVRSRGWLALMTTEGELGHLKGLFGAGWSEFELHGLPGSNIRVLALTRRKASLPE
jgi:16S rRNA (guanine527-N7)-methyltransferase